MTETIVNDAAPAALADDILLAPVSAATVTGLIRLFFGRDPQERDMVERLATEIHAYVLRHFLVKGEFAKYMLLPLAAKSPIHYGPFAELSPAETEALERLFGPGPWVDGFGMTRLPELLTRPHVIDVIRRKCLSKQLDQLNEVFEELALRHSQIAAAGAEAAISYRQTHSRRWVATLPFDRHPATGRPLEGELVVMKPGSFRKLVPVSPAGDGFEAVFETPLVSARPHQGFGELRIRETGEDNEAGPCLSVRTVVFSITGDNIRGTLDSIRTDIDRATALADQGLIDDALALATRRVTQVPFSAAALTRYAELSALTGDLAEAAALIDRIAAGDCDDPAAAHDLAARLALADDDLAEAAVAFAAAAPAADLADALLRYAAGLRSDDVTALLKPLPQGVLPEASDSLTGFAETVLDNLAQKPVKTGKARSDLAHALVAALVRAFAPLDVTAAIATAAAKIKLVEPLRLASEATRLFTVLPVLGHFTPAQVGDGLVLPAFRALVAAGDNDHALAFARQVDVADPEILRLAGDLLADSGDNEAAITTYDKVLALGPDAEISRKLLQLELNAVRQDPTRPQARLQGLLATERERLNAVLEAQPGDDEARLDLARTDMAAGRYAEAASGLDAVLERRPRDDDARFERMRLAEQQGDWSGVIAQFDRLAEPKAHEYAILLAVKAYRLRGDFEGAQAVIAAFPGLDSARLHREKARNLFMLERFDAAQAAADAALALYPDFADLHLLAAAIAHEMVDADRLATEIAWLEACPDRADFDNDLPFYAYALARMRGEADAVSRLNPAFSRIGAGPVTLRDAAESATFDAFQGTGAAPVTDGPLVSVIMTTFNAEAWAETAVNSILRQSYANLELIIVDDGSTDGTQRLLKKLRDADPRITLKLKSKNEGTYVSKNNGIERSKGEFVAFQDSDDWSHPDRLALSIGVLLAQPDLVAVQTQWVRMTEDARPVIKDDGYISHRSAISLVFRRKTVVRQIGYFDSVRVSADREFLHRLELSFGQRALGRLAWPLMFGRAHTASLTADAQLGLTRQGASELRRAYEQAAQAFHATVSAGASPYMPYPLTERLFAAPAELLPDAG